MKAAGLTFVPNRKLCWLTREKAKAYWPSGMSFKFNHGENIWTFFTNKVLIDLMSLRYD